MIALRIFGLIIFAGVTCAKISNFDDSFMLRWIALAIGGIAYYIPDIVEELKKDN